MICLGEILDLTEIAATPAIIEGCVKGIEKEGNAEFKVFGKTESLSLDLCKTKPTDVPDRSAPKPATPTRTTGNTSPTYSKKAKRVDSARIQIKHNCIDNTAMGIMLSIAGVDNKSLKDGDVWAIMAAKSFALLLRAVVAVPSSMQSLPLLIKDSVWPQTGPVPFPEHYQLIAGYVENTIRTGGEITN